MEERDTLYLIPKAKEYIPVEERVKLSQRLLLGWCKNLGITANVNRNYTRTVAAWYDSERNRLTVSLAMLRYPDYLAHALPLLFPEVAQ